MNVAEAIETIQQAGGEFFVPEPGRLQASVPSQRPPELEAALATIRENRAEVLAVLTVSERPLEKPPPIIKGQAVCLYSDLVGENLWIVADEQDAQALVGQGERRGQVYTPEEVRLVIAIKDPAIVKQVHEFKREFNTRMLPPHKAD